MSIRCRLCGFEYNSITNTHLKFSHGITTEEYRETFPDAELMSRESRKQLSGRIVEYCASDEGKEARKLLVRQMEEFYHNTEEGRRLRDSIAEKVSKANTGHEVTESVRQLMSENRSGIRRTLETRRKMSKSHLENWQNPDYARSVLSHRKPNGVELWFQSVLDERFPGEWKYVGDGQVWLSGRNPDFLNVNGRKLVIEVFGFYYHDPYYFSNRPTEEELLALYRKFGFGCLVFWEYDMFDEEAVVARVSSFVSEFKEV